MAGSGRQQRGEATRGEILNVARRLFSDFGYHHTGIADIQAATGLTKGAFYHHFRAKQELALAVLERVREDYRQACFEPAMSMSTPAGQLAALLDRVVTLNERPEWRNCRLLATLCAELSPADGPLLEEVRSLEEELIERVSTLVAGAQQVGEVRPGDAGVWAELIVSVLMGLALGSKLGAGRLRFRDIVAQLQSMLFAEGVIEQAAGGQGKVVRLPGDEDCL
jgi:AcrR family transcriptional regulator